MDFSFPYPVNGTVVRPPGQGCTGCVHSTYCPALYWFRRYNLREPDNHNGIQCSSWSGNPADIVTAVNQRDLDEEDYMAVQGIGSEANRNGMTDQSGDTWRRP